jgi:hypothetical protein
MLGVGGSEIVVIGLIFLIIFGPSSLPKMARDVGRFVNEPAAPWTTSKKRSPPPPTMTTRKTTAARRSRAVGLQRSALSLSVPGDHPRKEPKPLCATQIAYSATRAKALALLIPAPTAAILLLNR